MDNSKIPSDIENIEEQISLIENDSDENEKEENQCVVFRLENQDYGIEIENVYEINRLKEVVINPVPKAPSYVEGIMNLRGEIVPVIDLRKKIGLPSKETGRETRILIVKIENKTIGLVVDTVYKVINVDLKDIVEEPEEIKDINTRFFDGIIRYDKKMILLLNIKEVLSSEEE